MAQAVAARAAMPEVAAVGGRMVRQVDRLDRLVADLADVSHIWTGEMQLRGEMLDPAWLVREVVEQQRVANPNRRIELLCEGSIPLLDADSQRLEQVLGNLLENAIKYSPDGGPVRAQLWYEASEVHLTVTDEGIGIPLGEQARLFERFYRGGSSAKRFDGLGAGLYISRRIIEGHGGRMWVESTPGQGSTFGFALPLA
jgi:signal transduction histidine kinase